jgi:ribose 5-phosphate isomerase B
MKCAFIGSDHAAVELRQTLASHLMGIGYQVEECGPSGGERTDYPDQAEQVAKAVASGDASFGVLLCGTGIGMSIAANKVVGVRAALVHDLTTAKLAAMHNNANILCLGGRLLAPEFAIELLDAWLEAPFEIRHQGRLDKISSIERERV